LKFDRATMDQRDFNATDSLTDTDGFSVLVAFKIFGISRKIPLSMSIF